MTTAKKEKPRWTEKQIYKDFCKSKDNVKKRTKIEDAKFHVFYDMEGSEHDHPDTLALKAYKHHQSNYIKVMGVRKGELLGFIYLYKNKYYFTNVVLSANGGYKGKLLKPDNLEQGSKLIAFFHSHPANGYGKYAPLHFSKPDTKTAICREDISIGYLRTPDGDVRRIDRESYNIFILDGSRHYPGKSICPKKCPCLKPHSNFLRINPEDYRTGVMQDQDAIYNIKKNKRKNNTLYKSIRNRFKRCRQTPLQKKSTKITQ